MKNGESLRRLRITEPCGEDALIDFGRHFAVEGEISGEAVPKDAILTVRLLDGDGVCLRYARQEQEGGKALALGVSGLVGLVTYPPEYDPDLSALKRYGFPPLMVRDAAHPEDSLRDATVKCWYSESAFKAIIVTATDVAHGLLLPDGMEYTDEKGAPYTAIPQGNYTLAVRLTDREGALLCKAEKKIRIGQRRDQLLCRFHPDAHREAIGAWSAARGICMADGLLPGYLNPYLGVWLYHMGLLKMYRANDIAAFAVPKIHMFLYDITADSTSYETELAYLQEKGRVGDPDSFTAYYYDIGEAVIGADTPDEQRGEIREFAAGEYMELCRMDLVKDTAQENLYRFDGSDLLRSMTDPAAYRVRVGDRFALTGVIRPWQQAAQDFVLREDNTYEVKNRLERLIYTFEADGIKEVFVRAPGLERIGEASIGVSLFEFRNLFYAEEKYAGKTVCITVKGVDTYGNATPCKASCTIKVEAK